MRNVLRCAGKTAAVAMRTVHAAKTPLFSRWMFVVVLLVLTLSLFAASAVVTRTKTLLSQGDSAFVATQTHPQAWRELEKQPWRVVYTGLVPEEERMLRDALGQHDILVLFQLTASQNHRLASYAAVVSGRLVIEEAVKQKNPELVKMALGLFVQAADRNERNEDAKFNLELLLTLLRDNPQFIGLSSPNGEQEGEGDDEGEGGGAGRGPLGGGY